MAFNVEDFKSHDLYKAAQIFKKTWHSTDYLKYRMTWWLIKKITMEILSRMIDMGIFFGKSVTECHEGGGGVEIFLRPWRRRLFHIWYDFIEGNYYSWQYFHCDFLCKSQFHSILWMIDRMLCFFEYLGRIVQVMRSEIFDIKWRVFVFFWGGSRFENGSFEPEIWFDLYQRVIFLWLQDCSLNVGCIKTWR